MGCPQNPLGTQAYVSAGKLMSAELPLTNEGMRLAAKCFPLHLLATVLGCYSQAPLVGLSSSHPRGGQLHSVSSWQLPLVSLFPPSWFTPKAPHSCSFSCIPRLTACTQAFCFSLCFWETQAEIMLLNVQSTRYLVKKSPSTLVLEVVSNE